MSKITPSDILETLFQKAVGSLSKSSLKSLVVREKIEFICRCNATKAPIRFLMSCLLAKINNPKFDIRKPYTEIKADDAFSGRGFDEEFVEPFVHKYKLPCNPTTAYLSPVFRNIDRPLTDGFVLVGRPRKPYDFTVEILNLIQSNKEKSEYILKEIIRFLLIVKAEDEQRMEQLIADLKQADDILPLATEEIVMLLTQHLNCKGSSRLPVLIVSSAYQTVKDQIGEVNKLLKAHNAADKQTGSIGDVEITLTNDDRIVTCYEMKDKRVTKTDIDVALQKLSKTKSKIDNYIFITTDIIEIEVAEYAKSLYEQTGVEFAVLDCIGFIRHYLHFFHRQRNIFLNIYQSMVLAEPTSSVSQPLKEAFLALRRAAEADKR
ncbi:restriction endonuclease, SacI family [bacterium]|nr:restriction endonuclease, SacI family [bacterium]MBU1064740.1 restriction endonuclease, SacI family [bacterium]MBU1633478.1 restriction endonuclease, SacI family [bacterium]MBU1873908.1 restriction endonuclease, SacI family [bacterium]